MRSADALRQFEGRPGKLLDAGPSAHGKAGYRRAALSILHFSPGLRVLCNIAYSYPSSQFGERLRPANPIEGEQLN